MSCPHYLGEIVLYLGLAALIGDQALDVWLILAWVVRSAAPPALDPCIKEFDIKFLQLSASCSSDQLFQPPSLLCKQFWAMPYTSTSTWQPPGA